VKDGYMLCRDSDDEAEGKTKFTEIVNEVEEEARKVVEPSGENKAAAALEKVFTQEETEESEEAEMETESEPSTNTC